MGAEPQRCREGAWGGRRCSGQGPRFASLALPLAALLATPSGAAAQVSPTSSATVSVTDLMLHPTDGTQHSWYYGNTIAVCGEQVVLSASGVLDVFDHDPVDGWTRRQRITPPNAGTSGPNVMVGRNDWLLVSHPPGVLVYRRSLDGWWALTDTIAPADAPGGFGASLDFDGSRLAVGRPSLTVGGALNAGGASVYPLEADGSFGAPTLVVSPAPIGGQALGEAVAVDGDRLVLGAPQASTGFITKHGLAFAFHLSASGATLTQTLSLPNGLQGSAYFGKEVAMRNGHLAIAAPDADSDGKQNTGIIWIYRFVEGTWVPWEVLTGEAKDEKLHTIAMEGDLLAVGDEMYQPAGSYSAGRAQLFSMANDSFELVAEARAPWIQGYSVGRTIAIGPGRWAFGLRLNVWWANWGAGASYPTVGVADDTDGNGVPNGVEAMELGATDCDTNLVPDAFVSPAEDCDRDGQPDVCAMQPAELPSLGVPEDGSMGIVVNATGTTIFLCRIDRPAEPDGPLLGLVARPIAGSGTPPGFVAIYIDPDQDGDPADAQLVRLASCGWPTQDWGGRVRVSFDPVDVGPPGTHFFAALGTHRPVPPSGMEESGFGVYIGPAYPGYTWAINGPMASFNIEHPFENPIVIPVGSTNLVRNIVCAGLFAPSADLDHNGVLDSCQCDADLDGDGTVGPSDLASLLGAWATPGADLDGDGTTGMGDLAILLGAWGGC